MCFDMQWKEQVSLISNKVNTKNDKRCKRIERNFFRKNNILGPRGIYDSIWNYSEGVAYAQVLLAATSLK